MNEKIKVIEGGVTAAKGFMAASTAAGIKYKNRQDMAMIYSKEPCKSAGTFTTNLVKAAPVKWDKNQVTMQVLQMHVQVKKEWATVHRLQRLQQKP